MIEIKLLLTRFKRTCSMLFAHFYLLLKISGMKLDEIRRTIRFFNRQIASRGKHDVSLYEISDVSLL